MEWANGMHTSRKELLWYWQRLGRMSPSELVHRLREQWRRAEDRNRNWSWSNFGSFDASPLPGLHASYAREKFSAEAGAISSRIKAGEMRLLGQTWPPSSSDRWWTGERWLLDPVTNRPWPGGTFSHDIDFRHRAGMGDVKFVWELGRLQFLPYIALSDPGMALEILVGWMEVNPPFFGIHWTSSIEAATRVVSVLAAIALGLAAPRDDPRVGQFLKAHAYWIARYPSLFSSANNHRIGELASLFLLGSASPSLRNELGFEIVHAKLESECLRQFYSDGIGAEQSLGYSAYSLEWLSLAGIAADAVGLPFKSEVKLRLLNAARALHWMSDSSGEVPHIGDKDGSHVIGEDGRSYEASVANLAERWLERRALPPALYSPSLRDSFIPDEFSAVEPPTGARCFKDGGYTVWRNSTKNGLALVVFDHGPLGYLSIAAHGHADALSVWLHWDRERVLVDAGTYLYHSGGRARDMLRGTGAHNTLCIENSDQSLVIGPFAWSRHARARLIGSDASSAEAEHDGYKKRFGLVHRRRVIVGASGICILDYVLGTPRYKGLSWSLGFTLDPDISVSPEGNGAVLETRAGRRIKFDSATPFALIETLCSPKFGETVPTQKLCMGGTVERRDQFGLVSSVRFNYT